MGVDTKQCFLTRSEDDRDAFVHGTDSPVKSAGEKKNKIRGRDS